MEEEEEAIGQRGEKRGIWVGAEACDLGEGLDWSIGSVGVGMRRGGSPVWSGQVWSGPDELQLRLCSRWDGTCLLCSNLNFIFLKCLFSE